MGCTYKWSPRGWTERQGNAQSERQGFKLILCGIKLASHAPMPARPVQPLIITFYTTGFHEGEREPPEKPVLKIPKHVV